MIERGPLDEFGRVQPLPLPSLLSFEVLASMRGHLGAVLQDSEHPDRSIIDKTLVKLEGQLADVRRSWRQVGVIA
jgi:hypothetical protein